MMHSPARRLAAVAVAIIASTVLALPAVAGQIGSYKTCSSNQTVGLGSGTHSVLFHTHRYESDSGTSVSYRSPTARTSWATVGPYKNAHWTVSNGAAEAMKSGSASCIYLP